MASQIAVALQSFDLMALIGPTGMLAVGAGMFMGFILYAMNRSASRNNPMPF